MISIRAIWLVARWEFTSTVMRVSFVCAVIGLPLAHLALAALIGFSVRSAIDDPPPRLPIAIVDTRRILSDARHGKDAVVRDNDAAMHGLNDGRLESVYVLDHDYLQNGKVRVYSLPARGILQFGERLAQRERAATVIRQGLVPDDTGQSRRIVEPILSFDAYRVEHGSITVETPFAVLGVLAGPFGVCFVLGLAIFLASGLLQQAMSSELQNRMLEVMLSVITPTELLAGKVAGLSAAGLLQVSVYLTATAIAAPMLAGTTQVSAATVVWSGVVFLAGYMLFAVLMAGTGALARDTQESTQVASVWLLLAATPFFFLTHISANSSSALARILTWFPPTAPVALLLRIGTGGVGTLERIAAITFVLVAAAAALLLAAALFRARMLSGGRLNVRRLLGGTGGSL